MKKVIAAALTLFAFLCDNEILTMFIIALGALVVVVFVVAAWAKTEKPKMPGSFDTDWGTKK